jgi:Ca-activated chloride channel family protein
MSSARLFVLSLLSLFVTLGCTGKGPDPGRKGAPTPEQVPPEILKVEASPREPASVIGPVRMQVLPQFQLIDARQQSLGMHVLIRLTGQGKVVGERPPLDLAVILDRSGSMAGE